MAVGGFRMTIRGAILLGTGAGLQGRLARNNKAVANRAGFGRRFLAASLGFIPRSFVPFSIQHK